MTHFHLDRVMSLLGAVDDQLPDGPPIHIRVGGGVGMMKLDPHRLTEDVDLFDRCYPAELRRAAVSVARSEGLADDWLNNDIGRFGIDTDSFDTDQAPLFVGRRLVVSTFDPHALLALKLLAGRETDTSDIFLLMSATGLTSPAGLRELLDDCFGHQEMKGLLDWAYARVDDYCADYLTMRWTH